MIADETADIAGCSQLTILLRYIKQNKLVERFLGFLHPTDLSSAGLAGLIISVIRSAGIPRTWLGRGMMERRR